MDFFLHDGHLFLIDGSLHDHHTSEDFKKYIEDLGRESLIIDGSEGSDL